MANEFQLTYNGAQPVTLVGLLQNVNGQFFNTGTSAFETYTAANVANYAAVAFTEIGATAEMLGSMPSGIATGKYRMASYIKAGANLAVSDLVAASAYGSTTIEWKGTAELSNAADLNVGLAANNTAIGAVSGLVGSVYTAVAGVGVTVGSVNATVGGLAGSLGSNTSAVNGVVAAVGSQTGYIGGLVTSVGSISTALAGVSTAVAGVPLATVADMKADAVLGATFNRSKGKFTFSGSTLTLLADDGTTVIGTVNITASAGTITARV